MSRQVPFDIEVAAGRVPGTLRLPDDAEDAAPVPAVLACASLAAGAQDHGELIAALGDRIVTRGVAFARYEPRVGDDATCADAASAIVDAAAVFAWLRDHDGVDAHAIGVLGVGLGAVVAAGLAARTNHVSRLCLVAPATSEVAAARLARPNGAPPLLDPDAAEAASAAWIASLEALKPARDAAVHDRPTLIVHGAADRVVASVAPYVNAVERAGHHVAHERIARADHRFTSEALREVCVSRVDAFLRGLRTPTGNGRKE